jgi:hypothetical protein
METQATARSKQQTSREFYKKLLKLTGAGGAAFWVTDFLLRFFDRVPGKKSIFKALILSFAAMVVIEVLSTLVNPNNAFVYLLIDTGMNVPRFLALGIVVGHLYDKLNGGA